MDYRAQTNLPVGIRNNNPGNFKADGTAWQGVVGNDGTFYIFSDDTWGIRASAKDLINKITNDGLDTITDIINAYAPASENGSASTANYIASVASDSGIGATDQLGTDNDTLHSVIRAMYNFENGSTASNTYISDADIDTGIGMANNPGTVFQAAAIAVQANPLLTVGIIASAIALWLIISDNTKGRG